MTKRDWLWRRPSWPNFTYDEAALAPLEQRFAAGAGVTLGASRHLGEDDRTQLQVDLLSAEAMETSAIEGEHFDRKSVQSSIRRRLGLSADPSRPKSSEDGVAEMMVSVYEERDAVLDEPGLLRWHRMVMAGRRDIDNIGAYRAHADPMQIVSGPDYRPKIHYEAPPSAQVAQEMAQYCAWLKAGRGGLVARAGLAHLWFELIHPFEDGNGRVGRAISEKILAQGFEEPVFTGLAVAIAGRRAQYYDALEAAGASLEITAWLLWFADAALAAQTETQRQIGFLIEKAKLLDRLRGALNPRQEKALLRVLEAGPDGFDGGLSAKNYIALTGASPATARRDLGDMVEKGAMTRTGENKGARYWVRL